MKKHLLQVLLITGVSLQISCGKINSEPAARSPDSGPSSGQAKVSKKSEFYVHVSPANGSPPALGDNLYQLRVVHAKTLQTLSLNAKIKLTYMMPTMPEMGKEEIIATRLEDGSFNASLFYSMSGQWEIAISIEDNNFQDEYALSILL